jgi:hypothetical protein
MVDNKVCIKLCPALSADSAETDLSKSGNSRVTQRSENGGKVRGSSKVMTGINGKGSRPRKLPQISLVDEDIDILQDILGSPELVNEFLSQHFQRRPFVVRGDENRVCTLCGESLFDLNIKKYLENSASDQIHVWLAPAASPSSELNVEARQKGSSKYPAAPTLNSITVDDPNQAYLLYLSGHSLYCRASSELEHQVITRALRSLGIGVCASGNDRFQRGEIETFFTKRGHTTDFHSDFQENMTIQLSGRKKWIFQSSGSIHPIRGCTPHFNASAQGVDVAEMQVKTHRLCDPHFAADHYKRTAETATAVHESATQREALSSVGKENGKKSKHGINPKVDADLAEYEVILSAGDVLYHPAGIWHRVECLEDSISINISLIGTSYADIVCSGLQQLLWENPQWRRPVQVPRQHMKIDKQTPDGEQNASAGVETVNSMLSSLVALISTLKAQDFLPSAATSINPSDVAPMQVLRYNGVSLPASILSSGPGSQTPDENEEDEVENDEDNDSNEENDSEEGSIEDEDEEDGDSDQDGDDIMDNTTVAKVFANTVPLRPPMKTSNLSSSSAAAYTNSLNLRGNPLTKILVVEKDMSPFGMDSRSTHYFSESVCNIVECADPIVLIVHSCFGNETLESATRVLVYVPRQWEMLVQAVLSVISPLEGLWCKGSTNTVDGTKHLQGRAPTEADSKKRKLQFPKVMNDRKSEPSGENNISSVMAVNPCRIRAFTGAEILQSLQSQAGLPSKRSRHNMEEDGADADESEDNSCRLARLLLSLLHVGAISTAN